MEGSGMKEDRRGGEEKYQSWVEQCNDTNKRISKLHNSAMK